ncbi:MAG TPA: monofunctional biosynthetic peptidoglycan transglycosylase [Methylomirabilota bacterium]|nr:monofunctional biosynthetic peptidoglycan transglycosylase [Methylomirabilota bacterium]
MRRWARRIVRIALIVVAIPLVLVPVYAALPPISTLMIYDTLTGKPVQRTWTPFEAISPNLVQSVMMSEDGQFCAHRGVDWDAVFAVIEAADEDGPSRGASTIPMQTAKNLFLWPGRSYVRKALEIPLALYMDAVWSKRRMMEIYLNIAEWGPGIYGAEAAAKAYFGKPAAKLSRREAALMAAALPNPAARNPASPSRRQAGLARIIERRAAQSGAYIRCLEEAK